MTPELTDITPMLQELAIYLRDTVPCDDLQINRYFSEDETQHIDVFTCRYQGNSFGSTIGLLQMNHGDGTDWPIHIELLMDAEGEQDSLDRLLSSMAMFTLNENITLAPGMVFDELFEHFVPHRPLRHILFMDPFSREDILSKITVAGRILYPLLAVPISSEESQFIEQQGLDAFEEEVKSKGTNLLDWLRPSMY